jgi:hypothetical protein
MSRHTLLRRLLVIGVPLVFAIASPLHPVPLPISNLVEQVDWWTTLHLLQIPLFLLMGCAILAVGWTLRGTAVTVSRVAALLFIAVYPAYDAYAGLGTGFIVRHAEGEHSEAREVLLGAAADLFESPVNGVLWGVGTAAWMVALVSLGLALRRGPGGWTVALLFAGSGVVLIDHGGPLGVTSFGLFAIGAALLEYRQARAARLPAAADAPTPPREREVLGGRDD